MTSKQRQLAILAAIAAAYFATYDPQPAARPGGTVKTR